MQRKGTATGIFVGIAIFAVALVLLWQSGILVEFAQVPPGVAPVNNCPDTRATSLKLQAFNVLNTTGVENYDITVICVGGDGSTYTITDTTAPTATSINCGFDYNCKATSSDGAGGDHGKLTGIRSGPPGAAIADGVLTFSALDPNVNIDFESTQHGVLETRSFDNDNNAFMYMNNDSSAGTYGLTAGGQFRNTSTNIVASGDGGTSEGKLIIGSGGKLDIRLDVRVNTNQDEQFEDYAYYVFYDMGTNVYAIPVIQIAGVTRTSDCGALNEDEARAYSAEDYCYRITGLPITNNALISIGQVFNALPGVNPSSTNGNINVTFVGIGSYTSTIDSTNVKRGAVQDDSSQTQVFTIQEWQYNVQ